MKRPLLLFALSVIISVTLHAQDAFFKTAEQYYRSSPFGKPFNEFLLHLMNDPTLVNKKIIRKTDSTSFFLEADYAQHQPFFFKPVRTRIILAEKEEWPIDSTQPPQTIFIYQLLGFAPAGAEGIKDIQEEFEKACRRYKRHFSGSEYESLKNGGIQNGEIRNYTLKNVFFHPLTVAWVTGRDHQENIFALTIRFQVAENEAYLPIATYGL